MRFAPVVLSLFVGASMLRAEESKPSHSETTSIAVKGTKPNHTLQTLTISPNGEVYALVGLYRSSPAPKGTKASAEIQVFSETGKALRKWEVDFFGQSIAVGPDNIVYVAGDGFIAKYDTTGKLLLKHELPHIAALLKDSEGLKARAEEQAKETRASLLETTKLMKTQADKLKKKDPEKLTEQEKLELQSFDEQIRMYEELAKSYSADSVLRGMLVRLKIINSIAVTDRDVFISCGESKGYGYAVWRMTHTFSDAKAILTGMSGCCGQFDIQAQGETLVIAENTRHRVGRYDREGKQIAVFGKRARESKEECFGSCCNPMNTRIAADGCIFTAESEGIVKKFAADGKYMGLVGMTDLKGGCKNVAVAVSPKGERVYFCDQPASRIVIMAKKESSDPDGK